MKNYSFVALLAVLTSCGEGGSSQIMSADFDSLQSCLNSMRRNLGDSLDIIRDTPEIVTGHYQPQKTFACERKVSGSSDVYYQGWYQL